MERKDRSYLNMEGNARSEQLGLNVDRKARSESRPLGRPPIPLRSRSRSPDGTNLGLFQNQSAGSSPKILLDQRYNDWSTGSPDKHTLALAQRKWLKSSSPSMSPQSPRSRAFENRYGKLNTGITLIRSTSVDGKPEIIKTQQPLLRSLSARPTGDPAVGTPQREKTLLARTLYRLGSIRVKSEVKDGSERTAPSPTVPKFGDWNKDPGSRDDITQEFNDVIKLKKAAQTFSSSDDEGPKSSRMSSPCRSKLKELKEGLINKPWEQSAASAKDAAAAMNKGQRVCQSLQNNSLRRTKGCEDYDGDKPVNGTANRWTQQHDAAPLTVTKPYHRSWRERMDYMSIKQRPLQNILNYVKKWLCFFSPKSS